ncbi:PQQ-binding-like beta-propeller repeat protein [Streptomyces albus subsp. chlorinus]|uniref:outer membrane protein assembly factor BamB family protein n=1 Tax=Streptomyces albus TaxID=1888 RepID=UPI00156DA666|nr:PQQ-binding-like beta-propeller repeat protein [Streptomyces albus]NSC22180.1 PQQ-binding-like beta-propeller repeat protein [Streptomyces albus subsp. chlorinus]
MSQPPPPPSQPPSGGFGAPQEPPQDAQGQPSYGYPQQPGSGQQPYGYPQQPPQPPQAPGSLSKEPPAPASPPGYGYPQGDPQAHAAPTQAAFGAVAPPPPGPPSPPPGPPGPPPGGYAQPPGGYAQPPGGYPYANTVAGTPGGGGGGRNNSKVLAIVSAVVAVVVLAGVGVFFLTKDDGKKDEAKKNDSHSDSKDPNSPPKNTQAEQIVDMKAPAVHDVTTVAGAWATDKVFAKSSVREMLVQDLATKKRTRISLKGNVCAASNEMTKDHKVAVVVQATISPSADCNRMVIVDLDAKKIAWDKTMPNADTRSVENVAISGDTVASAWIGGSVGYKISSEKKLWEAKPSNCRDTGYQGGKSLVAVVECGHDFDRPQVSVQKLDPDTGKAKWKYEPPKGVKDVRVASTDPLVLVAGAGDELSSDVLTVGEDKKLKAKISLGERYNKPCELEVNGCYAMAVGPDTVYLSTKEHDGSSDLSETNEVMAFDFTTGRPKWKSEAGEDRTIIPFKMQGDNVLGYKTPSLGRGGEIVTIEPKKGKQTTLLKMPASDIGQGEQAFSVDAYSVDAPLVFEHNRFFLQDDLISERSSLDDEAPRLAVGYGPTGG